MRSCIILACVSCHTLGACSANELVISYIYRKPSLFMKVETDHHHHHQQKWHWAGSKYSPFSLKFKKNIFCIYLELLIYIQQHFLKYITFINNYTLKNYLILTIVLLSFSTFSVQKGSKN